MTSAGKHVIVDGYVSDPDRVFSAEHLSKTFETLVSDLGMVIIFGPVFKNVDIDPAVLKHSQETGEFLDEGGLTGICVISTSHLTIHTWPLQRKFSADIFSCKDFDHVLALNSLKRMLGVVNEQVAVLNRSFADPA